MGINLRATLRYLSFAVMLLTFVSPAFAASYNCPTTLQYTTCAAGYYMTRTTSTTDKTYYGTIVSGNDCKACSTLGTVSTTNGVTCPGGSGTAGEPTVTCQRGRYWNGSSCTTCPAGYACAGFSGIKISSMTTTYGRVMCTGATYAGTGAGSCTPCPTGYTSNTSSAKISADYCTISCAAGTRVVTPYAECTTPTGAWYAEAQTVYYGALSQVVHCSKGYDYYANSTTPQHHSSANYCVKNVANGKYLSNKTATARYIKVYSPTEEFPIREITAYSSPELTGSNYLLGKPATNAVADPTYATDGSYTNGRYTHCPAGTGGCVWDMGASYTIGAITFDVMAGGSYTFTDLTIAISTNGSSWTIITAPMTTAISATTSSATLNGVLVNLDTVSNCAAGRAKAAHQVVQTNTSACGLCTGATYSYSGATTCSTCPEGYRDGTASGKTSIYQCYANCEPGEIVWNLGGACSTPPGGWYMPYGQSITYGSISPTYYCTYDYNNESTNPSDHLDYSNCLLDVPGGNSVPHGLVKARYIGIASNNGDDWDGMLRVTQITAYTGHAGDGEELLYGKGGIQGRDLEYATDGNYNNDTFADCTGDACVWDIGEIRDVGSIMFVLLSEGRVYRDITIAVSEDGAYWVPVMNGLEIHTWVDSIGHPNMVEVSETYYPCGAGSASGAHQVRQGDTSGCGLCSAGTFARGGASTCASCTTGSYNTGTGNSSCTACPAGKTTSGMGQTSCSTNCSNNNGKATGWIVPTWATNNTVSNLCKIGGCAAGYWSNANAACAAVGVGYYSANGALARTQCPTGYNGGTNLYNAAQADCQINCPAGTRIASPNASTCTTPSGPWYTPALHLVNYGQITQVNYCMAGFDTVGTSASYHDAAADCVIALPAGKGISSNLQGRYVRYKSNGSTANTGNHMVEIQAFANNAGTGTNLLSGKTATGATSNASYATDDSWTRANYTTCPATGCVWDIGTVQTIGSLKFALFTDGRTYHDVEIAVSIDNINWTNVLGPMELLTNNYGTAKPEMIYLSDVPKDCVAGTARPNDISLGLGSTYSCAACSAGTFSLSGATACTSCVVGSYNTGTGNSSCIACSAGHTNSANGSTSCPLICPNKNNYSNAWKVPGWNADNTVNNLCKLSGCMGGYWSSNNEACVEVGPGYWSSNGIVARGSCPAGTTTIGYGAGADEAADCGRVLNFGDNKLYLRSTKKTTPSLNVNIGGTTYYGNMKLYDPYVTTNRTLLRINSSGNEYQVHDDSVSFASP